MKKSEKIGISCALCVLAAGIVILFVWLFGGFGIGPLSRSASFEELAAHRVDGASVSSITVAYGSCGTDGADVYEVTSDEEKQAIIELVNAAKYEKLDTSAMYPGSDPLYHLTFTFSDGSTAKWGDAYVDYDGRLFAPSNKAEAREYLAALMSRAS